MSHKKVVRGEKEVETKKSGWMSAPMPNHLSIHPHYYISLPLNHKTTQRSVEKVAMWSR